MLRYFAAALLVFSVSSSVLAQSTINPRNLPAVTSPVDEDIFLVYLGLAPETRKVTLRTLKSFISLPSVKSAAIADDANDDAAVIQAEIDALSADGGTIELPCGDLRINTRLTIGDGTATTQSTKHNVTLRGCGLTSNFLTDMTVGGTSGTRILWYGAAGGTMIKFAGPISSGGLSNLTLNGSGPNVAATLVEAFHHVRARYENLTLQGYSGIGFRINSTTTFAGMVIGADDGIWQNVKVNSPTTTTAVAMDIGTSTWSATQMSVSRNLFLDVYLKGGSGATGRGLVLRFADNDTFIRPFIEAGSHPLEIAPPTGGENYPIAINFFDAVVTGQMTVTGSWTSTSGVRGLLFWPWITTDGASVPPIHAKVRGVDDQGEFFGTWTGDPITGADLRATSTAQFDKTSDTTLANITGLSYDVEASERYGFTAWLPTTSNVAGGVKFAVSGTATATSIIYEGELHSGGLITQTRATALTTEVCALTAVTAATCHIKGTITVNAAGTLTVQFAQNTSNGAASSVLVGSQFYLEPIGD